MTAPRIVPNQKMIDMMDPKTRAELGLKSSVEINKKLSDKSEKEIQIGVEAWLRQRGYWPRTPAFLDGKVPASGWYVHIHQAQKNPIVLDLLILRNDGRYLELELKTSTGPVREHQEAILKGRAKIARSIKEAMDKVKEWEDE